MNSLQFRRHYQPPSHDKGLIREGFDVVIPLPASVLSPHRPVLVCLSNMYAQERFQDSRPASILLKRVSVREDLIVSLAVGTRN